MRNRENKTYADVKEKFVGYWPKAKLTDMEKKLWDDRLKNLNMNDLWEALDNVKVNHSSVYPQLSWVLKAYHEIAGSRRLDVSQLGPTAEDKEEFQKDQEAIAFNEKVDKDLATVSDDEKRRAAESLPFAVSRSPSEWGTITKGLVWVKLFGSLPSSVNPSLNLGHGPPV